MSVNIRILVACLLLTPAVLAEQGRAGGPPAAGTPPAQSTSSGQPPLPEGDPTAAISGVVLDGGTGQPVPGAIVSMSILGRGIPAGTQTRQLTDDKGRFAFVNVWGDATYMLSATKFGFLDGGVGRDKSPSDPLRGVSVRKDQWLGGVRVTIWRPAAISGMVRDENGEPMVGIIVRVLARHRLMGRESLAAGPITTTDDRGMYRIAGLVPGRYLVQVPSVQASMPTKTSYGGPGTTNAPDGGIELDETSRLVIGRYPLPPPPLNGRTMTYATAFHPSASTVADARTIDVKYGDDRPNVDITLSPVPAVRVSGVVEGPSDAMTLMTVRLLAPGLENLGQGSETATALVDGAGQFTFVNVPPGTYLIDAPVNIYEFSQNSSGSNRPASFPSPPGIQGWGRSTSTVDSTPGLQFSTTSFRGNNAANYSGRTPITVGAADLNGVVVRLKPMVVMSGTIVLDLDPSQPAPQTPPRFFTSLDPANGEVYLGSPRNQTPPDAPVTEFMIPAVMSGQYWLRSTGPAGWLVKSVVWKGRDYTTTPIDTTGGSDLTGVVVTMTNNKPTLSGVVQGTDALKAEDCTVVIFPVERAQWQNYGLSPMRFKTAPIAVGGGYTITSVPAGDYVIAAIDRTVRPGWLDPAVLTQLEAAGARVSLTWGAKITQSVPVVVIR